MATFVSIDKCCVLGIAKGNAPTQFFFVNNLSLPVVPSSWLGYTVTKDLSPSAHVGDIVVEAYASANLIHQCFVSRNVSLLVHAFTTYVRPLLEHNCIIWSPSLKCDIDSVQQVKRRFTKKLKGFRHYSYDERLKLLNLKKLETRRQQQDLIWCYKILCGIVRVDPDAFLSCVLLPLGGIYTNYISTITSVEPELVFSLIVLLRFGISYQCRLLIYNTVFLQKNHWLYWLNWAIRQLISISQTLLYFHSILLFICVFIHTCHLLVYWLQSLRTTIRFMCVW